MTTESTAYQQLKDKIETNTALVGVIGLGYVGLPLAHAVHQGGLPVLGFDIDQNKIDKLDRGENYLKHLGAEMTTTLSGSERFSATTDFARLGECDAVIVAVPTPLGRHQDPDLSYVLGSARDIGRALRPGQLVSLESTTYPGTTRDDFLPALLEEARRHAPGGAKDIAVGENLFVAYSPEREDPGRKDHDTTTIPKLVGGVDGKSTELAMLLYSKAVKQAVAVKSAEVAEAAKLLENIFRAVNIALVNEMKTVLTELDVDVWDVIDAASTKPFGFMPFYPGPGLGGHCIPIDPFYLTWKAKEVGRATRFIELAGEVNTQMPEYVVHRVGLALNEASKPVKGFPRARARPRLQSQRGRHPREPELRAHRAPPRARGARGLRRPPRPAHRPRPQARPRHGERGPHPRRPRRLRRGPRRDSPRRLRLGPDRPPRPARDRHPQRPQGPRRVDGRPAGEGVTVAASEPTPMDRVPGKDHYGWDYVGKTRIYSYAHQLATLADMQPESVVEIGPGPGVVTEAMRAMGVAVTTVDVQEELAPDVVGSVLELPFEDASFDASLCSQVLEHLPFEHFATGVTELRRVAKRGVVMSVPDCSSYYELSARLPKIGFVTRSMSRTRTPGEAYMKRALEESGHYWEIGWPDTPLARVLGSIREAGVSVERTWRVRELPYHRFFKIV